MANEVTIYVRTRDDGGKGFRNQEKQALGLKQRLGGLKSGFMGVLTAGGAFAALNIFKNAIKGASDLNESMSKTGVVFGQSAGDIHKWAQSAATSMGLSRNKAEEFAGSLGLIFTQMGSTTAEASRMSRSWVQLAADIGSFNNADPSEVLDAMQSATRGEYDELQRYVPSVNAAAVEHQALAMSGKESADALSAHDKLLALQAILFKDTAKAQGDFGRTAGSAANQQKILSAQWEDAQAKLGKGLLPVLTKVTRVLSAMIEFGSRNAEWIVPLAGGILAVAAATKAAAAAQLTWNVVVGASPWFRLIGILGALAGAFMVLRAKTGSTGHALQALEIPIIGLARILNGVLRVAVDAVVGVLLSIPLVVAKAFSWLPVVGGSLGRFADSLVGMIKGVDGFFSGIDSKLDGFNEKIKSFFHGGGQQAKSGGNQISKATGQVSDAMKSAKTATQQAKDALNDWHRAVLGSYNSQIGLEQAIDDASKALKDNGKTLDINRQKGRDNKTALLQIASAALQFADDVKKSGGDASAGMNRAYNAFIRTATGMGMSRSAAKALAQQIGLIPSKHTTNTKVNTGQAIDATKRLQRAINGIRSRTIPVYVKGMFEGQAASLIASKMLRASGGVVGAAGGGPRSRMTLVGEQGPELVDLAPGSTVHSNADTRRILGQAGGDGRLVVEFVGGSGSDLERLLWGWIKENVRIRGGKGPNSAQKALGA